MSTEDKRHEDDEATQKYNLICAAYKKNVYDATTDVTERKKLGRAFWKTTRKEHGSKPYYQKVQNHVKASFDNLTKTKNNKRSGSAWYEQRKERHLRQRLMGMNPRTKRLKQNFIRRDEILCSKSERNETNDFVFDIPYSICRKCPVLHLTRLWDEFKFCNSWLNELYVKKKIGKKKKDAHDGISLAHTATDGGRHGKGRSGSFGWNPNLQNKAYHELQFRIIAVCSEILYRTYGSIPWFKQSIEAIDKNKRRYLIKNTPCTSIWWSCEKRHGNIHIDRNAYGASFLFVPNETVGGEITFDHGKKLDDDVKYLVKPGDVVGGRWGRNPHYNQRFKERRNSVVMYGDYRILYRDDNAYLDRSEGTMETFNRMLTYDEPNNSTTF